MQLSFDLRGGPPAKKAPPKEEGRLVLTVTTLTRKVRNLLEDGIGSVLVEGEVSNLRKQSSGHVYFTLKDSGAQIACALFASQTPQLRGMDFRDGSHVRVSGQLTVYESRGQYQIIVRHVEPCGIGALQARFEELKKRLHAEGLFAQERKRPLPRFPRRIGVVTSPTGAAIRDFLHVLQRRHRGIEVLIHPARVQGRGAAAEIAEGIRYFSEEAERNGHPVDIVVVTRGGGSLEDLWEFNEEAVARAVAASRIPVISAVGHEIDFTLCDFAADLRAPTPSVAAEILSADSGEILTRLSELEKRLSAPVNARLHSLRSFIDSLPRTALYLEPARILREHTLTLDHMADSLSGACQARLRQSRLELERFHHLLEKNNPDRVLARFRHMLDASSAKITTAIQARHRQAASELTRLASLLEALNPQTALARGYTITFDQNGRILRSVADASQQSRITTRFFDGELVSGVVSTNTSIDSGNPKHQNERNL